MCLILSLRLPTIQQTTNNKFNKPNKQQEQQQQQQQQRQQRQQQQQQYSNSNSNSNSKGKHTNNSKSQVSNLSRQFLFRQSDVGNPKSTSAARVVKDYYSVLYYTVTIL